MDSDCPPLLSLLKMDFVVLSYFTREEALKFLARVCRFLRELVTDMDRGFFLFPRLEYELAKTERRIEFICKGRPIEMSILVDFARMLHSLREQTAIFLLGSPDEWTAANMYARMNILGWHHVHVSNERAWVTAQQLFEQKHAGSSFYGKETTVKSVMYALKVKGTAWRKVHLDVNDASSAVDVTIRWTLEETAEDFRQVMLLAWNAAASVER